MRLHVGFAALLALWASFAAAQIGEPLPQLTRQLATLEPVRTEAGFRAEGVTYTPELRNGALYRLSGAARLDPAGRGALAQLLGAASGYGAGIAQPLEQFLAAQAPRLLGQGDVPVALEEFVLTLSVTGPAAPYRATFALALSEVPDDAFPAASHTLGPKDAPIVIREFSDFQCPYCAQYATQTLPQLKEQLLARGDVRFEYHHLPLTSIHANAQIAAEAAECVTAANAPRDFWTYHDALFARQQAWQGLGDVQPYFVRLARELGLSGAGVEACLTEGRFTERVQGAFRIATQDLGLNSTPSVFVGGYRVPANAAGTLSGYERAIARLETFAQD